MNRNTTLIAILLVAAALAASFSLLRPKPPVPPQAPTPPAAEGETTNAQMLDHEGGYPTIVEDVQYADGVTGTYARPDDFHDFPGVVMIHEWWGLNGQIKDMARQLASEGYEVLAVDLFGTVATSTAQAQAQVAGLDQEKALANLRAAAEYLRAQGAPKVASLGWCFGGGQSLRLALSGAPLDATVIYYGQLVTESASLTPITWPVLGVFGDKDQAVPVESAKAFAAALNEAGVRNEIYIYPDVGHAFANPSGANYAPDATADAWAKTLAFLKANLQ